HVLGVAAVSDDGSVPPFSNRDSVFVDLAAPGDGILSTLPLELTAVHPSCADQGYSDCGSPGFRDAQGTSFAAPQVSAAAALLLRTRPDLTAAQVAFILEHSAVDANATNGCSLCRQARDSLTGWGRLDVFAAVEALTGPLPPKDRFESNDDAGAEA